MIRISYNTINRFFKHNQREYYVSLSWSLVKTIYPLHILYTKPIHFVVKNDTLYKALIIQARI